MTLKTQLKVMNNVSTETNEITAISNCSNFIEFDVSTVKNGIVQLSANELREFLWRVEPLAQKPQQ